MKLSKITSGAIAAGTSLLLAGIVILWRRRAIRLQAAQDEAKTETALPQLGHSLLNICGFRCASPNSAKMSTQFNHPAEYSGISATAGPRMEPHRDRSATLKMQH